jgi:hypothetical protein
MARNGETRQGVVRGRDGGRKRCCFKRRKRGIAAVVVVVVVVVVVTLEAIMKFAAQHPEWAKLVINSFSKFSNFISASKICSEFVRCLTLGSKTMATN